VFFVNDTSPQPQFRRFANFETMRRYLMEQPPGTFAVPVFGLPAYYSRIAKPTDRRYLILPDGTLEPLFDSIEEIEVDGSFMLGDPDMDITPVTTATLTQPATSSRPARPPRQSAILEEDDIDEEEDPEGDFPSL
jgi:hypothetical protein